MNSGPITNHLTYDMAMLDVGWNVFVKYLFLGKMKRKGTVCRAHNLCFSATLGWYILKTGAGSVARMD
jgi:hypothetical protein